MKTRLALHGKAAGQTAVEFALVASLLLMLVFGIIELGLTVYDYNTVSSAAREAVRYAIVHSPTGPNPATTSEIQQVAINYAPDLNLSTSDITVTFPADANLPSEKDAKVVISHKYFVGIPFVKSATLTLTSTSQMLVSQ